MTSRQRVAAALAHREPDRTPIFEYVLLAPVADAILGRPYADGPALETLVKERGWLDAIRQRAIDIVELARKLGHDMLMVVPREPPPAAPVAVPSPPVFKDPDDPLEVMAWRVVRAEESLSPPADESLLIYQLVREELQRWELDLPIMAPAYGHGVWTDTVLMQAMLLAPQLAARHFELATQRSLQWIERFRQLHIELIGIGGDFAGNRGPLISPALYRQFIVPEVRQLSRRIHAGGGWAVNASDGDLWPVIDDFLAGCAADGYIEIDLRAGMDLAELKRRFGATIVFFGNLDCANLLSFGTPAEVQAHTRECLRQGWGGGGHIVCCNNAITESVPLANYLAIGAAYREYFGLTGTG